MTRDAHAFVTQAGWQSASRAPLAGDASNRRYERLTAPDGHTAVLMDAPPETGENTRPFVRIARYLKGVGLSAPEILHHDDDAGFLLIEDLGDRLFAREMATDPAQERPLYHAAAGVLSVLHRAEPPGLLPYASETTVPLAALAYDWYLFGATGAEGTSLKQAFSRAFKSVIAPLDKDLNVLIQRDYHAENLLWLPDREGAARVGLLDFQDAMLGHRAYDLVSILQDARRDVSRAVEAEVKSAFVAGQQLDPVAFDAAYAIFGFQRNMRILGGFSRLCMRNGKAHYVDLIPRVWGHIQTNLEHPALHPVKDLIARDLPAPTPEIQARLKEECGKWAGR
ncbi:MAG: phosphotransferase [Pseudomonadota bacterium]